MIIDNELKPDYLKVAQDEIELGKRNADIAAQKVKNDFILGMKHAANEAKLTDAQCEVLSKNAEVLAQEGWKLKKANEMNVTYEYKDADGHIHIQSYPLSLAVDVATWMEKNANGRLTQKEIANFETKLALKYKEIENSSVKAYVGALVSVAMASIPIGGAAFKGYKAYKAYKVAKATKAASDATRVSNFAGIPNYLY